MTAAEVERLRQQYKEVVAEMDRNTDRAAYLFGRLEIITQQLFRLIDRH